MAIDLGTSFIKAGVYNTESQCVAEGSEAVRDYRPAPGVFIQKGDELYASVLNCVKQVCAHLGAERARRIAAIAFTGQMAGFIGVGRDWEDITTWSCSLDSRYMPYAERQMAELKDMFLSTGGTNFPQMAPKFAWFSQEFPAEAKKVVKYLMISGFVIGRMGGLSIEDAVMDRSYATWTGLSDVRNDRWSDAICSAVGLDQDLLPRIVGCSHVCGRLCEPVAAAVGLPAGIPLVAGAGDKIAGCLGAAATEAGDMVLEASSYGQISCCITDFRPDMAQRRYDILPSAIPGQFFATHFAAGSGITLDWFVGSFARAENQDAGAAFAALEAKISQLEPGSGGLFSVGLLGGSSMPSDGSLRGMFIGFDWSHKPEHFYRSLIESYTYDFSLAIARIRALYPEYALTPVKMIGGGAKSPVWLQMCADLEGRDYVTISRKDVSMWGACILAGHAAGIYADPAATARQFMQVRDTYRPDPARQAIYQQYREVYRSWLVELKPFYERIAALQLKQP
jgi:xylulokinase